jgi:hypothetical protein
MYDWILAHDTNQMIVRSMVRRVKKSGRINIAFTNETNGMMKNNDDTGDMDQSHLVKPLVDMWKKFDISDRYFQIPNSQVLKGQPKFKGTHVPLQMHPKYLIDMYIYDLYKNAKGGQTMRQGQVQDCIDDTTYRIAFDNGKQRAYDYEDLIAKLNHEDEQACGTMVFPRYC